MLRAHSLVHFLDKIFERRLFGHLVDDGEVGIQCFPFLARGAGLGRLFRFPTQFPASIRNNFVKGFGSRGNELGSHQSHHLQNLWAIEESLASANLVVDASIGQSLLKSFRLRIHSIENCNLVRLNTSCELLGNLRGDCVGFFYRICALHDDRLRPQLILRNQFL